MMAKLKLSSPAWDTENNYYVWPISNKHRDLCSTFAYLKNILPDESENETSKGKYECPECKANVFPRRTEKKRWHFVHYVDTSCNRFRAFETNSESFEHKLAKVLLEEILKNQIPIIIFGAPCNTTNCTSKLKDMTIIYTLDDVVQKEYRLENGGIADVVLKQENNMYIFEIFHTSRTKNETRPDPWFEIKASEVIQNYDNKINTVILHDIKKYSCGDCPQEKVYVDKIVIETPKCETKPLVDINPFINSLCESVNKKEPIDVIPSVSNIPFIDLFDKEVNMKILLYYGINNNWSHTFNESFENITLCPCCDNFVPSNNIYHNLCSECDMFRFTKVWIKEKINGPINKFRDTEEYKKYQAFLYNNPNICWGRSCGKRVYFDTEYNNKDELINLGCKWDRKVKMRYTCVHNKKYNEILEYGENCTDDIFGERKIYGGSCYEDCGKRVYLGVAFDEKDTAKKYNKCKWDPEKRKWFSCAHNKYHRHCIQKYPKYI